MSSQGRPMYADARGPRRRHRAGRARARSTHSSPTCATSAARFQATAAGARGLVTHGRAAQRRHRRRGPVPFRRWVEVELHHVDLGIGYELEDLPGGVHRRGRSPSSPSGSPATPTCRRTTVVHGRHGAAWHTGARPTGPGSRHRRPARRPARLALPAAATAPALDVRRRSPARTAPAAARRYRLTP